MSESTPVYGLPYLGKDDTLKETTDVAASSATAIEGEIVRLDEKDTEQDGRLDALEAAPPGGGGTDYDDTAIWESQAVQDERLDLLEQMGGDADLWGTYKCVSSSSAPMAGQIRALPQNDLVLEIEWFFIHNETLNGNELPLDQIDPGEHIRLTSPAGLLVDFTVTDVEDRTTYQKITVDKAATVCSDPDSEWSVYWVAQSQVVFSLKQNAQGGGGSYDDTAIWESQAEQDDRLDTLESLARMLNGQYKPHPNRPGMGTSGLMGAGFHTTETGRDVLLIQDLFFDRTDQNGHAPDFDSMVVGDQIVLSDPDGNTISFVVGNLSYNQTYEDFTIRVDQTMTVADPPDQLWDPDWLAHARIEINSSALGAKPAQNGLPTGGLTDQVLAKASGKDYVTKWVDMPSSGGGGSSNVFDPALPDFSFQVVRHCYTTTANATGIKPDEIRWRHDTNYNEWWVGFDETLDEIPWVSYFRDEFDEAPNINDASGFLSFSQVRVIDLTELDQGRDSQATFFGLRGTNVYSWQLSSTNMHVAANKNGLSRIKNGSRPQYWTPTVGHDYLIQVKAL